MTRPRLNDWLSSPAAPRTKSASDFSSFLGAMRQGGPGQWSQNLLKLSQHFTGAAFLAINTKATQASGSRFEIFERTDDPDAPEGKRQLPHYDPIHELFEDPNPQDTFHDLLYQVTQQRGLTGISLTWKVPTRAGDVREIYSIPTATAWPVPPTPEMPRGAYRVLPYSYFGLFGSPAGQTSAGALIPADQIIRIKNHHPLLRYDGYATLTACSLQVDTIEAIDKGRHTSQQLGCDQSLALESDPETSIPDQADIDRIRAQLAALYAGPGNVGKLFIAPPGSQLKQISTSPKDMAYQEGWGQILDFILAGYGVPMAVAGLQQNMSYATLYSSLRAFCYLSLGPELGQTGGAWNKHLVRPTWGKSYGLQIIPPEFKDEALEEQKLGNDLKCGARKIKEIRRMRNLDHLDEPWVEERAFQSQPTPPGGKDNQPRQDGQEEDPDVNNARPKSFTVREDLLSALESAKTNGHAKPIKR